VLVEDLLKELGCNPLITRSDSELHSRSPFQPQEHTCEVAAWKGAVPGLMGMPGGQDDSLKTQGDYGKGPKLPDGDAKSANLKNEHIENSTYPNF